MLVLFGLVCACLVPGAAFAYLSFSGRAYGYGSATVLGPSPAFSTSVVSGFPAQGPDDPPARRNSEPTDSPGTTETPAPQAQPPSSTPGPVVRVAVGDTDTDGSVDEGDTLTVSYSTSSALNVAELCSNWVAPSPTGTSTMPTDAPSPQFGGVVVTIESRGRETSLIALESSVSTCAGAPKRITIGPVVFDPALDDPTIVFDDSRVQVDPERNIMTIALGRLASLPTATVEPAKPSATAAQESSTAPSSIG